MTLIEDAKNVACSYPLWTSPDGVMYCFVCPGWAQITVGGVDFVHHADCSWLAMPRIIAALEAAERVISALCEGKPRRGWIMESHDALGALETALRGEATP